jgi:glutamate:GABA antiporter
MHDNKSTRYLLGPFSIAMITITSLDSMRNLPAIAMFGSPLILFFLIGAVCFLLPSALVSTELATTFDGGIYHWVKEAFGKKCGFLAIWFQWVENIIWYPTLLSFIAGTMAYLISPSLAQNKFYLIGVIISVFWTVSLFNLAGIKASAKLSTICGVIGLVFPMLLIITLGIDFVLSGQPLQIHFTKTDLFPNWTDPNLLVSLTAVVLCFCGMEIATVHKQDVKNPEKDYPKAMLMSVIFIIIAMLLGTLSIAIIVPPASLSLVSGMMQAFYAFLQADHFYWLAPLVTFSIVTGTLGTLNNWVIAPSRGLLFAMEDLKLGKEMRKLNARGTPKKIIIAQAIIVSLLSLIFLLMPSVNGSYWILTAMTAQLYMCMYILMFSAVIKLRHSQPTKYRPYKIPGGRFIVWIVGGLGFITSLFVMMIGFAPPAGVDIGSVFHYETIMICSLLAMALPPFIIYLLKRLGKLEE